MFCCALLCVQSNFAIIWMGKRELVAIEIFYWKKKHINFIYNRLFCCNHICYYVNMVSVRSVSRLITSASLYHPRYKVDPPCTSVVCFHGIMQNWLWQFRLDYMAWVTRPKWLQWPYKLKKSSLYRLWPMTPNIWLLVHLLMLPLNKQSPGISSQR